MSFRTFLTQTKLGFMVEMLVAAVVAIGLLTFGALQFLKHYTHHGEETLVPSFKLLTLEEATALAEENGLSINVVDSSYQRRAPLGTILEQSPAENSHTKAGREIYVVINAKQIRQLPLPPLTSVSYRQAEATLNSMGMHVGEVIHEPSIYNNLVLDVRYQGHSIEPGTRLAEGSTVDLVVGVGGEAQDVAVPALIGKNVAEAKAVLLQQRLILGGVFYDVEPEGNDNAYFVYKQSRPAGSSTQAGSRVDIFVTTQQEKVNMAGEDEFFDE